MGESRINNALERLKAAMTRIEVAKANAGGRSDMAAPVPDAGSDRVLALVNAHEKLREDVSETLRELDHLIEEHGG